MDSKHGDTSGDLALDRLVFFSDAVFAIAVTLLVLDIHVPSLPHVISIEDSWQEFLDLSPSFFAFGLSFLVMPIVLIAVMYFLMIRPQMKRAKEHRSMLEKLGNGDEVITNGGIAGVVREIGESFITIEIADNVRVRVQKAAIGNVLPKGTLKSA